MSSPGPSPSPTAKNTWVAVCQVADIPALGARRVARSKGLPVAIFRNAQDEVFALLDRCPHKAGPLSQGIVSGQRVACPLHNWNIDLQTGCAHEPDSGSTPAFACKTDGGTVYLCAQELATLALDQGPPQACPARGPV